MCIRDRGGGEAYEGYFYSDSFHHVIVKESDELKLEGADAHPHRHTLSGEGDEEAFLPLSTFTQQLNEGSYYLARDVYKRQVLQAAVANRDGFPASRQPDVVAGAVGSALAVARDFHIAGHGKGRPVHKQAAAIGIGGISDDFGASRHAEAAAAGHIPVSYTHLGNPGEKAPVRTHMEGVNRGDGIDK